ncbi:replication protein A 70 kDa DNA-binding subunit B, partial [Tanacetum coccineum]
FKINFHKKIKVKAIHSVFSSKYGFSFVPFTEFVEDNVKEEQVVDVIGLIAAVGDVIHGERKGKNNRRMVVELTDIDLEVSVSIEVKLLARVGDDTSSLQVSNLTSESAEALAEKSFFYGTKYVNLEQLMDVVEDVPNDDESSSKKVGKRNICNTYKCETCGSDILDVVPKFRVQVRVSDDSACASFLMFDQDVFNIVDRSAYVLKEVEANKPNAADYLDDLNKLIGKIGWILVDTT